MSFERVRIKHGTDEWLAFRNTGIGGSDAAAVLGENPWKTNVELWEEKTGKSVAKSANNSEAVTYGLAAEKYLARLFALDFPEYTLSLVKNEVFVRDNFMFASLDAMLRDSLGRRGVLEIKTANIFSSMSRERWSNRIPQNYYIQLIHYLLVTEFDFAVLKAQLKSSQDGGVYLQTKHYFVDAHDPQVIADIEALRVAEQQFWNDVKTNMRPALILARI